jgi:hypothetical protein
MSVMRAPKNRWPHVEIVTEVPSVDPLDLTRVVTFDDAGSPNRNLPDELGW